MKALDILSHLRSPFPPLTCLYGKNDFFMGLSAAICSILMRTKIPTDYPCKSPDHDHQWADLVMA